MPTCAGDGERGAAGGTAARQGGQLVAGADAGTRSGGDAMGGTCRSEEEGVDDGVVVVEDGIRRT